MEKPIIWEKVQVPTETTRHCGPDPPTAHRAQQTCSGQGCEPVTYALQQPMGELCWVRGLITSPQNDSGPGCREGCYSLTRSNNWKVKDPWNVDSRKGPLWFLRSSRRCNTFSLFTQYLDLNVNVLAARVEAFILISFSKNTFRTISLRVGVSLSSFSWPWAQNWSQNLIFCHPSPSCMAPKDQHLCLNKKTILIYETGQLYKVRFGPHWSPRKCPCLQTAVFLLSHYYL